MCDRLLERRRGREKAGIYFVFSSRERDEQIGGCGRDPTSMGKSRVDRRLRDFPLQQLHPAIYYWSLSSSGFGAV